MIGIGLHEFVGGGAGTIRTALQMLGLKELESAAAELERSQARQLKEKLKKGAKLVLEEGRRESTSRRVRRAFSMTVQVRGPLDFEAEVGTERRKAFFAHFLEFGTKASAARPWSTQAFPFLAPAVDAKAEQVFQILGAGFEVI